MTEIKVAVLGYGGIARAHMSGYDILDKDGCGLRRVALCDINPDQFTAVKKMNIETKESDLDAFHLYTDFDEMLAKEEFDMLLICLPTYLHKEYTIRALRAGKHVLCEKPMALSTADCAEMITTAKKCDKHLMIGQCLRFENNYLALKKELDSGKHGKVLMMNMKRLSALPRWGFENWFTDFALSGGEIMDMSIHDYDMARFLFGEPTKVSAVAVGYELPEQCSNGRLYYENGPIVTVDGSWAEAATFPFACGFHVICEKATIAWDGKGAVRVYPHEGEAYDLETEKVNCYGEESRFFGEVLRGNVENTQNPPESAMHTITLIEKLKESAAQGGAILAL